MDISVVRFSFWRYFMALGGGGGKEGRLCCGEGRGWGGVINFLIINSENLDDEAASRRHASKDENRRAAEEYEAYFARGPGGHGGGRMRE